MANTQEQLLMARLLADDRAYRARLVAEEQTRRAELQKKTQAHRGKLLLAEQEARRQFEQLCEQNPSIMYGFGASLESFEYLLEQWVLASQRVLMHDQLTHNGRRRQSVDEVIHTHLR